MVVLLAELEICAVGCSTAKDEEKLVVETTLLKYRGGLEAAVNDEFAVLLLKNGRL